MSSKLAALASLAADNVGAHALAYAAACAPLALALAPWIAGTAVAEGLRREGHRAADAGPDVVVVARALGRHAPLDPEVAGRLAALDGVLAVERRIAGAARAGDATVLVVGVEPERLARAGPLGSGAAPARAGECLVGAELARELGLRAGSRLALEAAWTRVYTVSGVLRADDALAGSQALVVDVPEAQSLFQDRRIGELCAWTRPGSAAGVARAIAREPGLAASTRAELRAAVDAATARGGGALSLLFAPVCALAAASFCALSWFASARRRAELAACKLAGFTGGDVLLLLLCENLLVALGVAGAAFLAAWTWVRLCGAALLAPFLVPDLPYFPAQALPAAFLPFPALLALAVAFSACACGSILASWRLSVARTGSAFA